jgi:hypothetical protein
MPWHEASPADFLGQLLGEVQTTDPSSLALAIVGIVTLLWYQILARPGHERRETPSRRQAIAKPPAAAAASPTKERRVA